MFCKARENKCGTSGFSGKVICTRHICGDTFRRQSSDARGRSRPRLRKDVVEVVAQVDDVIADDEFEIDVRFLR